MSGSSQNTSSTSSLDPTIKGLITSNASRAQGIADQPFQGYQGNIAAPLSQNQGLAMGAAQGLNTAGAPALSAAQGGAAGLLNYQAPSADFSGLIQNYMNPYTTDVTDATMAQLDQQRQREITGNTGTATQAGAFGGSRSGVADALTNDSFNRTAATTLAGLNSAGYNSALGAAQSQAQLGQQGSIAAAGINQGGVNSLSNIANQQQTGANNYLSGLLATGGVDQSTQQAGNSAAYQEFLRSVGYPYQGQTLLNQSLGLLPQSGTTSGTTSTNPGAVGILGGAASLGLGLGSLSNSSLLGSWLGGS